MAVHDYLNNCPLNSVSRLAALMTPPRSPVPCCDGYAMTGDYRRCTCWEPVFDAPQADLDHDTPTGANTAMCHDCAYRPGSPEHDDLDKIGMLLYDLPAGKGNFFCHQGIRRAVAYRHPDGRQIPAEDGDYQPPICEDNHQVQRAYKADGSPADLCFGFLSARLAHIYRATGANAVLVSEATQ